MVVGSAEFPGPEKVWGCVLIGGKSERMGRPKHLLEQEGMTWLEVIVATLRERTEQVVVSGEGIIPASLQGILVVPDAEAIEGPLAGIMAIMRKFPGISWLVAACDMPYIQTAALDWLLAQRTSKVAAILPELSGDGQVEPLLAYYDHSCLMLIERIVAQGSRRPGALVGLKGVITPRVPVTLHSSWRNVNFPEDRAE